MKTYKQYAGWKKPSWSPPAWLFGPVWTVLYLIIAVSFGYVGFWYFWGSIPFMVALPFALNLVFNAAFTPIQFGLRSFYLSAIDIILVWLTLIWAMGAIHSYAPWVTYVNIPYLAWVSFATVLQLTVTYMNR